MSLAITILTGNRPGLLRSTMGSLWQHAGELCRQAHVILYVNGVDEETLRIVRELPWVDDLVLGERDVKPIGEAISFLMARVPPSTHVMHLEDDWVCLEPGFYEKAAWILRANPAVGQVRLRRHYPPTVASQQTLPYNGITLVPVQWEEKRAPSGFWYRVGSAHFTFNPSIVRRSLLSEVYPCESEGHAMRRFHETGILAAQLLPGAFLHIGGGAESLRERLGRQE